MLSGGHAPTAHGHHHGVAADAARDRVETHGMHPNPSPLMATKLNAATASAPPPRVRGPLLGLDAHTTRPQGPSRPTTPAGRLHHPSPRTIQTHPTGPTRAHPVPKGHPDPPNGPNPSTPRPQGPSRPTTPAGRLHHQSPRTIQTRIRSLGGPGRTQMPPPMQARGSARGRGSRAEPAPDGRAAPVPRGRETTRR